MLASHYSIISCNSSISFFKLMKNNRLETPESLGFITPPLLIIESPLQIAKRELKNYLMVRVFFAISMICFLLYSGFILLHVFYHTENDMSFSVW